MDRSDSQSSLRPTDMKAQAFAGSWYKVETSVALDTSVHTTGTKLDGLIQVIDLLLSSHSLCHYNSRLYWVMLGYTGLYCLLFLFQSNSQLHRTPWKVFVTH